MKPNTHGNLFHIEKVVEGFTATRRNISASAKSYTEALLKVEAEEKRQNIKGIVRPVIEEQEREVTIDEEARELEATVEEQTTA